MSDTYIGGLTTDSGEQAYDIPVKPKFKTRIRRLQNNDPGHADNIFNPLMQCLIDNIFTVKNSIESHTVVSDSEPEIGSCVLWLNPAGGMIASGEYGAMNVSGTHVGDYPPDDTEKLWIKPAL